MAPMMNTVKEFLARIILFRVRLLPMVIFFAVLLLGVKVTNFVNYTVLSGDPLQAAEPEKKTPAGATAAEPPGADAAKKAEPAGAGKQPATATPAAATTPPAGADKGATPPVKDTKAPAPANVPELDPLNLRPDEYQALSSLAKRREELAQTQSNMPEKEAVLKALEKRIKEEADRLTKVKDELKSAVSKIEEEENVNTKRLVKVAESMEPAQAAKILEGVEYDILLEIMEKMSEKKASAVIATMPPEKASYLMTSLAKRKKMFLKDNPDKAVNKS